MTRSPAGRSRARLLAASLVSIAALGLVSAPAGAQDPATCPGVTVDANVAAASIPGGSWAVQDACVPLEAVYEAELLGYRLVGGLAPATYTDGHVGRIAFLTAKVADDRALTLVGVEDAATSTVTWAYVDGAYAEVGPTRSVQGDANAATVMPDAAPGPVEPASVQLSVDGTGTDLATAQGPVADQLRTLLAQAAAALSAG
jgi:hypothetical protein